MVLNPDVQRKAQEEIDRVVGTHRLPGYEDRPFLPYIEALYREVMRWRPPFPLSIPHATIKDDIYKGYFIPKGAAIFANIWAMTHNPAIYPDPDVFNPERFITQGRLNNDDQVSAFGFGRRGCVGRHMGSATVWMMIVSVLASFDIAKAKDVEGNEAEVNDEYTESSIL